MNVKLYEIQQQGNKYCGPSVMSALTGLVTKECATIIRAVTGRDTPIKGMSTNHMLRTLIKLGYAAGFRTPGNKPNLRTWVRANCTGTDVYLVVAGHHFILVQGKFAMCGISKDLTPIDDHPYARSFVTDAYLLKKVKDVDATTLIPHEAKSSSRNAESYARTKAKKLAEKVGCHVEVDKFTDHFTIWVYAPDRIPQDHDPYHDDGHFCDTWAEALARVQKYHDMIF